MPHRQRGFRRSTRPTNSRSVRCGTSAQPGSAPISSRFPPMISCRRWLFVLLSALVICTPAYAADSAKPNVVVIYCDDLGYADIGPFGATGYVTPHLDRMAVEGMKFTDFYVSQAVCSASRVALLTGCYSNRVGILGALGPTSKIGISDDETTLGEVAKQAGYSTAIYGKWHLGHLPQYLPTRHGF